MEVHHHSHTESPPAGRAGKKFTHYLWEFLMLFLAVFCGFLAENFREHQVEHNREKQFMRSLAEDLETDTAELKKALLKCDSTAVFSDSLLMYLATQKITGELPMRVSRLSSTAGQRLTLINTDRTSSQLKNSGSMRLIRNQQVSNAILAYWKQIEETKISLDRYITYRDAGRELLFKLWVLPLVYQRGLSIAADSIHTVRVIDPDPKKWDELTNLIAISGAIARTTHTDNLKQQFELATRLIELIKKGYHLE